MRERGEKRKLQEREAQQRRRSKINVDLQLVKAQQDIIQTQNEQITNLLAQVAELERTVQHQRQQLKLQQQQQSVFPQLHNKHNINFNDTNFYQSCQQLILNIHNLFIGFAPKSAIKQQLVKHLQPNINRPFISLVTGLCPSSISNSIHATDITKQPRTFRSPKSLLSFTQMEEVLDVVCPVVSGRNFRVLRIPVQDLFALFSAQAEKAFPNVRACSISYFRRFLKAQNIRHSAEATMCPDCEELNGLSKKEVLDENEKKNMEYDQNHVRIAKIQQVISFFFD